MKIAFIFPGQCSQYIGMGKSVFHEYHEARMVFEEASDILGYDISRICFQGPISQLVEGETLYCAIAVVCVATYRSFIKEHPFTPFISAGHSLGEYAALVCNGALSLTDSLNLIRERTRCGIRINREKEACMLIINGTATDLFLRRCDEKNVWLACQNSEDQIILSGYQSSLKRISEYALLLGAQVIPLFDSPPFHCNLMNETVEYFSELVESCRFCTQQYPVISNTKAEPLLGSEDTRKELTEQLVKPVLWKNTIQRIENANVSLYIDFGPRDILQASIQNLRSSSKYLCLNEKRGWQEAAELLKNYTDSFSIQDRQQQDIQQFLSKCITTVLCTPTIIQQQDKYEEFLYNYQAIEALESQALKNVELAKQKAIKHVYACLQSKMMSDKHIKQIIIDLSQEAGFNINT